VFVFTAVPDAIYQLIAQRGLYPLETLVVATVLAIIAYVWICGPVTVASHHSCAHEQIEGRSRDRDGRTGPTGECGEPRSSKRGPSLEETKEAQNLVPQGLGDNTL